ncbi:hypothetical protein GVN18_27515 [Pseudomonas sp. ODNR1LW]|nr:hypothetical protein [Pseudomonas sp. ODNR1LW]
MKIFGKIPVRRQLTLAWLATVAGLIVMGLLILANLMGLQAANADLAREERVDAALSDAQFRMARQENSYRGYLLSGEAYYIDRLETHRAAFRTSLDAARAEMPANQEATINEALGTAEAWRRDVALTGASRLDERRGLEADQVVSEISRSERYLEVVDDAIDRLKDANETALAKARVEQAAASRNAMIALTGGLASLILLVLLIALAASRIIAGSTFSMVGLLQKLKAEGATA